MTALLSVELNPWAVEARAKTVSRRLGWWDDTTGQPRVKPGERMWLCRKSRGGHVDAADRLVEVVVVSATRERLSEIYRHGPGELAAEGFPGRSPEWFIQFFTEAVGGDRDTLVTRIEWRYLDEDQGPVAA